jgi:hypothetical protein
MIPPASPSGRVAFQVEGKEGGDERLAGEVLRPVVRGEDRAVEADTGRSGADGETVTAQR